LTAVQVVEDAWLTSQVVVENRDAAPKTLSARVQGAVTLQGAGISLEADPTLRESAQVAAADDTADLAGADSHDFGARTTGASSSVMLSAANQDLSAFVGTGTVALSASATATGAVGGPGNFLAGVNSQAAAAVRVIYH